MSSSGRENPFSTPTQSIHGADVSDTSSLRIRELRQTIEQTHNEKEGFNEKSQYERHISYRLVGEFPRPWVNDKRFKKTARSNILIICMVFIALCLSGYICWDGARQVKNQDYCLVMEDNFETFNKDNWDFEIQLDGYGNGAFDWTTDSNKVTFTDSEGLHIVPQLTTEVTDITEQQLLDGHTVNLTKTTCTGKSYLNCQAVSSKEEGTMINPVMSARLTTKGKKFIKYGKIEVTAKLPKGDWLWPAIWMMPEEDKYGGWPASGEIDIMESRGNDYNYPNGGNDVFTSALHWGPTPFYDAYWRTIYGRKIRRSDFTKEFHTFGLEWSGEYLYTYLDSRIQTVLRVYFKDKPLWQKGEFNKALTENQTFFVDPWSSTGRLNTPFDENFYLILNVAVGSRNGWFLDGVGGKPWVDAAPTAMRDWWAARDKWLPTWGEGNNRGMTVKSVKMWQEGKCGGGK